MSGEAERKKTWKESRKDLFKCITKMKLKKIEKKFACSCVADGSHF